MSQNTNQTNPSTRSLSLELLFSGSEPEEVKSEPSTPVSIVKSQKFKFKTQANLAQSTEKLHKIATSNSRTLRSNTPAYELSPTLPLESIDKSLRTYKPRSKTQILSIMEERELGWYNQHKKILDTFNLSLENKILEIKTDCDKLEKTKEDIEKIEGHLAYLESQKNSII